MATWFRTYSWPLGLALLLLVVLLAGLVAVLQPRNSMLAGLDMPPAQHAYWEWVRSINREGEEAVLASGLDLLAEYPDLPMLYLRLAEVCLEAEITDTCRRAMQEAQPAEAQARLYRDAALIQLWEYEEELPERFQEVPVSGGEMQNPWVTLARFTDLDPALARLVVDQASLKSQAAPWLKEVEGAWRDQLAADSSAVGAAFGLGYAAVRRSDWETSEPLLRHAARLQPNDPQAYRELGRIYFSTEQPDKLEEALAAGIEAAEKQHDLGQELVLRGNLGWSIVRRSGDLVEAESLLTTALEQSRSLSDEASKGFNFYRLASIYVQQYRYDEALAFLDSADARLAEHAPWQHPEVLSLRGTTLSRLVRFREAEAELEAAIAEAKIHRNVLVRAQALNSLAFLHYRLGRFEEGRIAGMEALELASSHKLLDAEIAARHRLASIEHRLGNFDLATTQLEPALVQARQIRSDAQVEEISGLLGEIALDVQDAERAQHYFEEKLNSLHTPSDRARAYLGLGDTYRAYRNFEEALRYYEQALEEAEQTQRSYLIAAALVAKARAYLNTDRYDEAAALLQEVIATYPDARSQRYQAEAVLGTVLLHQAQYREALAHLDEADRLERQLQRPAEHWNVLYGQAMAYWRLQQYEQADQAFRSAIELIETLRENLYTSTHRAFFVQHKGDVYEQYASFLDERGRTKNALHFVERARSRGLVDLLFTTQQVNEGSASRSVGQLIEMERRVRALAEEVEEAVTDQEGDKTAYQDTRLAQLRREYARAEAMYEEAQLHLSPEERIYTFAPLHGDSIQASLAPGEALLFFDIRSAVMGTDAQVVAYVVLPDLVRQRVLTVSAETLPEKVRFFRRRIGDAESGPGSGWEAGARRLFDDLIQPIVSLLPTEVKHLHIVPEGILHYLPFAALQDEASRFLIEQYTLSIAPSANMLKLSRDRNPRQWRSMLLVGDPDGRLPGSRNEVQALGNAGPARQVLLGAEVTQDRVEEAAGQYDIVHFATHGRFDAHAPERSHLELHGEEQLSVEEIGQLELNAYLVTLSACESALSGGLLADVPDGDEWVGLNQAFFAAGTPTVMATLWAIDDAVSSDLMISFYDALNISGKALALAKVQRHFIRNTSTKHPFYWAPYTVIGDPL